jgi:hypothetical protein
VLETDGERGGTMPVEVPYLAVARAKLVVDWENELRGNPGRGGPAAIGAARAHRLEGGER